MKKMILAIMLAVVSLNMKAMSDSKIRNHARFLSDRMAYELDLSPMQYDDCYEINYDFIYSVNRIMDDVVYGYVDAIDLYYDYLDYRNEDMRHILSSSQYLRYMAAEYFFRPIYSLNNKWNFRIYQIYNNHSFYYFDRPSIYSSYYGSHARKHYSNGYYSNRYSVSNRYASAAKIRGAQDFSVKRRNDFGANIRQRSENRVNQYRNSNQQNRASDPRYNSNKSNVNSPSINNRNVNKPAANNRNNGNVNSSSAKNRNNIELPRENNSKPNAQQSQPKRQQGVGSPNVSRGKK